MSVASIHHVSLVVADTAQALRFYCDLLGMAVAPRPDLGFPGAWLAIGSQQIHLLQTHNVDPVLGRPERLGRDRHIAFTVHGLDEIERRLTAAGIEFTRSRSGRAAIFCRDRDGNGIELIASPGDNG